MNQNQIAAFLDAVEKAEGRPPISEAKVRRLRDPSAVVVIAEQDEIHAVAVAAEHPQPSGDGVWEVETAVDPSLQFMDFEREVLRSALDLVPRGSETTVWSQRSSLDAALAALDFTERRVLAHMAADLPLHDTPQAGDHRTMGPDERASLVTLNNQAFEGHPEAGAMTEADIDVWQSEGWFNRSGVVMVDLDGEPVGFCVTKVHPNGDGEIYRVGVSPDAQGKGIGTTLAVAAYELLSRDPRTKRGTLWVDCSNEGAVALYESIGLEVTRYNREFARGAS